VIWSNDPYAVDNALAQRMRGMTALLHSQGLPEYLESSMSANVIAAPDSELVQRSLHGMLAAERHRPASAGGREGMSEIAMAAIAASAAAVALACALGAWAIFRSRLRRPGDSAPEAQAAQGLARAASGTACLANKGDEAVSGCTV